MKVAVLIVTYNGAEWIQKCLNCVFDSDCAVAVFVCDNGSTDKTTEIVNGYGNKITLTSNKANVGFGVANNLWIKKAYHEGFDFILLINQDVYIQRDTISILKNLLLQQPQIGLISPLHLNGKGNAFDRNFLMNLNNARDNQFINDLYFGRKKDLYYIPNVNAACWMLPRITIEKIGGFDPLFFHYGEDDNYCQRVLYHGLQIGVTANTFILHDRDDRGGNIRPEFIETKQYRGWLAKITNVLNENEKKELSVLKRNYFKSILKCVWSFKFKDALRYYKEFAERKQIFKQVLLHKKANRKGGLIWL